MPEQLIQKAVELADQVLGSVWTVAFALIVLVILIAWLWYDILNFNNPRRFHLD